MLGSISYKVLFISVNGNFKVTFDTGAISLQTTIPFRTQQVNGKVLPQFALSDFKINIDSSKIHITLSGSVLADILDKIAWIFKSIIMQVVTGIVNDKVPPAVASVINNMIISSDGQASFGEGFGLDFQTP